MYYYCLSLYFSIIFYVDIVTKSIKEELKELYTPFHSDTDGSIIVELDYALYGTIEAGRIWYDYFRDTTLLLVSYITW
jgi:hypothetical protein